jgi:hypothetical protein
MQDYCLPLELIAFAIHPGNTESTTTVCLDLYSSCLYLTSQGNLMFADVRMERIRKLIEYLVFAKAQLIGNAMTEQECEEDYWENHCALAKKQDFRTKIAATRAAKKVKTIRNQIHLKLWRKFKEANLAIGKLDGLKNLIRDVEVILDSDIFMGRVPEKTGFHGESRIIRFLFIRDYPAIHRSKAGDYFRLEQGSQLPKEMKAQARKWFKADIKSHQVAMGSSQGTCAGCGECLDKFGIKHGDIGNRPQQWLDPLTMCGKQGGVTINKPDSLHAIFVAFRSIPIGPSQAQSDNLED